MKTAQLRLWATVFLAISVIVLITYGLGLRAQPLTLWSISRGFLILLAVLACLALAFLGLRREQQTQVRRLLENVQTALLAESKELAVTPGDPAAQPVVSSVRQHVDQLRSRLQLVQVQRKDLEIQLRLADAERRQSQIVINGISDAVLVTNTFDELVVANPAAAALFHFDLNTSIRKPVSELLGPSPLAAEIGALRQSHHHTNRQTLELTLDCEGQPHTFTTTLSGVMDSSEQLSAIVTVLHDTTREKAVSKMKSDFVSHVSHELRTPLSSIKAYAELLVDGEANDDKTRAEFYHIIQSEADRLSRLIDNILNISRIEAGITRTNKTAVSLTAILKEVLEVAKPNARDKNITLVDQVAPAFFQIEADRDMIYQSALNLLSNAIKYTPAGGTVKVSTAVDEVAGTATVEVTDTGVGIPPDAMKHLFEKFFRVEAHKGMAKGSGLGLNLTRQMIETIHHGTMLVRSEVGKGSTFGFTLPLMT